MKFVDLSQISPTAVSHNPAIQKRVMLENNDLRHLTNFSQACFAPGQVAPGHSHPDMAEVFFVESGQGTITVNGQPHPLTPGVCVAIAPHEHHEVANTGPVDLVLTYFGLRV